MTASLAAGRWFRKAVAGVVLMGPGPGRPPVADFVR
jgi:hypothetical protein